MKVSVDVTRFLHLILLVALTIGGGQLLILAFEWNGLAAYGSACTVVCQISNVLMKFWSGELDVILGNSEDTAPKARDNKAQKNGKTGNPKKKRN
jgi:hypothetical protein